MLTLLADEWHIEVKNKDAFKKKNIYRLIWELWTNKAYSLKTAFFRKETMVYHTPHNINCVVALR